MSGSPSAGRQRPSGDPVNIETYSFLTTTPNPLVETINHERMPVLLTEEREFETWLTGSDDEAFALARPFDPKKMRIVREGSSRKDEPREMMAADAL